MGAMLGLTSFPKLPSQGKPVAVVTIREIAFLWLDLKETRVHCPFTEANLAYAKPRPVPIEAKPIAHGIIQSPHRRHITPSDSFHRIGWTQGNGTTSPFVFTQLLVWTNNFAFYDVSKLGKGQVGHSVDSVGESLTGFGLFGSCL